MVLQLAVMNGFEIKYLIDFAKKMLRETKGNYFRFSDTNLTQSEIKKLINLGLLDCTAQLEEEREIPLRRYETPDLYLYDTNTKEQITDFRLIKEGHNYRASRKKTKTIKGVYNIYTPRYTTYESFFRELKRQVLESLVELEML